MSRFNFGIIESNTHCQIAYCATGGGIHAATLFLHVHNTEAAVRELLELGALSAIGPKISPNGSHSWHRREPGVVVANCRDRGDELARAHSVLLSEAHQNVWLYLFDCRPGSATHGKWLVKSGGRGFRVLHL